MRIVFRSDISKSWISELPAVPRRGDIVVNTGLMYIVKEVVWNIDDDRIIVPLRQLTRNDYYKKETST